MTTTTKATPLTKFVMKGVTSKAAAREAFEELEEIIESLVEQKEEFEDALCTWEDSDDREERAEAKERLEQVVADLDYPLSRAGQCAGQKSYEPEDV